MSVFRVVLIELSRIKMEDDGGDIYQIEMY